MIAKRGDSTGLLGVAVRDVQDPQVEVLAAVWTVVFDWGAHLKGDHKSSFGHTEPGQLHVELVLRTRSGIGRGLDRLFGYGCSRSHGNG